MTYQPVLPVYAATLRSLSQLSSCDDAARSWPQALSDMTAGCEGTVLEPFSWPKLCCPLWASQTSESIHNVSLIMEIFSCFLLDVLPAPNNIVIHYYRNIQGESFSDDPARSEKRVKGLYHRLSLCIGRAWYAIITVWLMRPRQGIGEESITLDSLSWIQSAMPLSGRIGLTDCCMYLGDASWMFGTKIALACCMSFRKSRHRTPAGATVSWPLSKYWCKSLSASVLRFRPRTKIYTSPDRSSHRKVYVMCILFGAEANCPLPHFFTCDACNMLTIYTMLCGQL